MLTDANFRDIQTPEVREIQFYVATNQESKITQ